MNAQLQKIITYLLFVGGCCLYTADRSFEAVLVASQWHKVLYEDATVRILFGETKPGEREPMHMHSYRRTMIIISGAEFEIEYFDGTKEFGSWDAGLYELPPDEQPAAYTNVGTTIFRTLILEYKS